VSLALAVLVVTAAGSDAFPLWDASLPVPTSADLAELEGVRFEVIKANVPDIDGYHWLHGVGLAVHREQLFASFGLNVGHENTATEIARYVTRPMDSSTWTPLQRFTSEDPDTAVSHGVFLTHQGDLWAFLGAFRETRSAVHMRAYTQPTGEKNWVDHGVVAEQGFWPMGEPLPMDNGNWLIPGFIVGNQGRTSNPAAVALSKGSDFTQWRIVRIPKDAENRMWGESTVLVDGSEVLCVARNDGRDPVALVSRSADYGETWTPIQRTNLPMAASKPYAGILSTGQRYLICTTTADAENRRYPLTVAVTKPGHKAFSKIFRIRDAEHLGPGESQPNAALSYPYAIEHDGHLYVGYSNNGGRGSNRNSAELAIIPIASLANK
jgi:hypothetical protein